MTLRDSIENEAAEANRATALLTDDAVSEALRSAAALTLERRSAILAANAADVEAANDKHCRISCSRILARRRLPSMAEDFHGIRTLAIDIGGSGLKMLVLDETGTPVSVRSR